MDWRFQLVNDTIFCHDEHESASVRVRYKFEAHAPEQILYVDIFGRWHQLNNDVQRKRILAACETWLDEQERSIGADDGGGQLRLQTDAADAPTVSSRLGRSYQRRTRNHE
jgi:hypothetical protein